MWQFDGLDMFGYRGLIIDPPWRFETWSEKGLGKSAENHYDTMSDDEILDLRVGELLQPGGLVLLWALWTKLPFALVCLQRWGLTYKTGGAWHKKTVNGNTSFGTGYVLRGSCEPFLIATLGSIDQKSRSVRNVIEAEIRDHSQKPDDQYDMVEQLVDGPYAELFANQDRAGWARWGKGHERGKSRNREEGVIDLTQLDPVQPDLEGLFNERRN